METHSSIIAQRIPWTEVPHGLQSMGSQDLGTTEQLSTQHKVFHCFNLTKLIFHYHWKTAYCTISLVELLYFCKLHIFSDLQVIKQLIFLLLFYVVKIICFSVFQISYIQCVLYENMDLQMKNLGLGILRNLFSYKHFKRHFHFILLIGQV